MDVVRLDVHFNALDALVSYAGARHVVVNIIDADPVIALGSLSHQLTEPLGVWLELSEEYSAPLAARDVATLSWLVPLDAVVVSAARADSNAEVIEALLTDDEVNFANDVVTLVGAYNRPAPPSPIAVWSWDGTVLRHGDESLHEVSTASSDPFIVTTYH